ncbi:MAG: DUF2726 domain-containing protein [Henriciella sp.]|nr:DUF2726 domain-containing protein [Henriciella sp.]
MVDFSSNMLAGLLGFAVISCVTMAMIVKYKLRKRRRSRVTFNLQEPADTVSPQTEAAAPVATYQGKTSLMTRAELAAFRDLYRLLRRQAYICPMVRIADLIEVEAGGDRSAWQSAFNKISAKHVDFAIINLAGDILFAVEVDDASHDRADRKTRDALVDQVFAEAGIPLVRVKPGDVSASEPLARTLAAFFPDEDPLQKAA